jgi:hypothetical protein
MSLLSLFLFLFRSNITEYERGKKNAKTFLESEPSQIAFDANLACCLSGRDDYDTGYEEILIASPLYETSFAKDLELD